MRRGIAICIVVFAQWGAAWADYSSGLRAYKAGDYASAFVEWRIAAAEGDPSSQFELATLYEIGLVTQRNLVQAYAWYNVAAAKGYPGARIARDKLAGQMTADQLTRARQAAAKHGLSAEQGSTGSDITVTPPQMTDYHVGLRAYQDGDYTKPFVEWRAAAGEGDPRSQYELARLYESGQVTSQNLAQAYAWYSVAAAVGHSNARIAREELAQRMTPEQMAKAQQAAAKHGLPVAQGSTISSGSTSSQQAALTEQPTDIRPEAPTPKGLRVAALFGLWCSDALSLELSRDSLTFHLPDGEEVPFDVRSYELRRDVIWVYWKDKSKKLMVTEFGNFSEDEVAMVQVRGRVEPGGTWHVYERAFSRC